MQLQLPLLISLYLDQSENRGCSIALQKSQLIYFDPSFIHLLGTGVITGSPPNLVVPDVLTANFGDKTGLTFASWMAFAIPVMLVNSILAWCWLLLLQRLYLGNEKKTKDQQDRAMKCIKEKYAALGSITLHELQVFVLFIILILLWFFQSPKFMPGWADFFSGKLSLSCHTSCHS